MYDPSYYRQQARLARRLADGPCSYDIAQTLDQMAQDFDEIAEDLESGAVDIRHPERMPQNAG